MPSDESDSPNDLWAKLQVFAVPIIGPAAGIILSAIPLTLLAAGSDRWPGAWAERNTLAAVEAVAVSTTIGFLAELILRVNDWISCRNKKMIGRWGRHSKAVARAGRNAAAMLASIGVASVGAIIGAAGGRMWFWRNVQIIPLGWEPETWCQAHEAAGAGIGFVAVLLLVALLFLIVCMWKRNAPGGKQVV